LTDHPLAARGYTCFDFDDGRWVRPVFQKGSGPAVIIMHEIPGLHPQVVRFADRVAAAGMTVYLPSLFGTPMKRLSVGYALGQMFMNVCIRREFNVWANGKSSAIVDWLRALARRAHGECGGRGVGAVGMCFTGGFALAMMTEPSVVAPVLSQPSMPIGRGSRGALDCSASEIACAKARMETEDLTLMGLRFKSDKLVPDERFERLREEFGDRFDAVELEDADAYPAPGMAPHSVLTVHLDDRPGTVTKQVEEKVIAFFKARTAAQG
jgi:dienelactone hydrolase